MLAIASLLDPFTDQQTRNLWQLLEEKCGLYEIKTAPFPHFSWFGCEDLQWKPVRHKLNSFCRSQNSFSVKTSGIGLFSGPVPILFVSLVKTFELMDMHRKIWRRLEKDLIGANELYSPEQWVPHITIAHGDVTPSNLCCAVKELAFQPLEFEVRVNNISVIYHNEEGVGIKDRFELAGHKEYR
jgi:2'-5' RNA ligase